MSNFNITPEQYNEVLLAGLKQIAKDAQMLTSGNIAHRAATIRANALQLIDLTNDQNNANGLQPEKQTIADAGGN